jgi:hypothetical protein
MLSLDININLDDPYLAFQVEVGAGNCKRQGIRSCRRGKGRSDVEQGMSYTGARKVGDVMVTVAAYLPG